MWKQPHTCAWTRRGTHKLMHIQQDLGINTWKAGNVTSRKLCCSLLWGTWKVTADVPRPTHNSKASSHPLNHEALSCLSLHSSGKRELLISKKWSQGSLLTRRGSGTFWWPVLPHYSVYTAPASPGPKGLHLQHHRSELSRTELQRATQLFVGHCQGSVGASAAFFSKCHNS